MTRCVLVNSCVFDCTTPLTITVLIFVGITTCRLIDYCCYHCIEYAFTSPLLCCFLSLDDVLAQLMMIATAGSDEELGVLEAWRTSSELGISGSLKVVGKS